MFSIVQVSNLLVVCLREGGEPVGAVSDDNGKGKFRQIMTNKGVHLLAFFILFYVGVEVTIGGRSFYQFKSRGFAKPPPGWIVTYIIEIRNGGPSSGYISSGFFGGMCILRSLFSLNETCVQGSRSVVSRCYGSTKRLVPTLTHLFVR